MAADGGGGGRGVAADLPARLPGVHGLLLVLLLLQRRRGPGARTTHPQILAPFFYGINKRVRRVGLNLHSFFYLILVN